MTKRSAIAISGSMVVALLAGMIGANRAAIQANTPTTQAVVQQAPVTQAPVFTERE